MGMRSAGFAVRKERSSLGEGGRGRTLPPKERVQWMIFFFSVNGSMSSIKIKTIIEKVILSRSLVSGLSNTVYSEDRLSLGHTMMTNKVLLLLLTTPFYLYPICVLSSTWINSDYKCFVTGAVLFHVYEILSVIR